MSERPTRYSASPDLKIGVYSPLIIVRTDDEKTRNLLFGQAISAVYNYASTHIRPMRDGLFSPFAFFIEPGSGRFLIGELVGRWDLTKNTFTLKEISLLAIRESAAEMKELMGVIQTLNPGVPKVFSDSYVAARALEARGEF